MLQLFRKIRKIFKEYIRITTCRHNLDNYFRQIIKHHKDVEIHCENVAEYPVWVLWWQGEENMPDIIKINYNSLIRNSNNKSVNLITYENYNKYIEIPQSILDRVELKEISITHLSDLIRVLLLSKYGGLWLDATVYVNKPLPSNFNTIYWTTKWKLPIQDLFKYPLWFGLWNISTVPYYLICQYMGIWYSQKNNPLFNCLAEFWLTYWQKENQTKPYYWTTEVFLIGIMYDRLPAVKKQIDAVPFNNKYCFDLVSYMNKPIEILKIKKLIHDTQFFYFSWKNQYHEIDPKSGEVTLYGQLIKDNYFLNKVY